MKEKILNWIRNKKSASARKLAARFGVSRQYLHRFLRELVEEGAIRLVGRTNNARYVISSSEKIESETFSLVFTKGHFSESDVWGKIGEEMRVCARVPKNVGRILEYAFTEMCNNAIEHSRSRKIFIKFSFEGEVPRFEVRDFGMGIFRNVMRKRNLKSEVEAMQDVLKGKQTTDPRRHTGEGIFFTSKIADMLVIKSFNKKLTVDNRRKDIFFGEEKKSIRGTRVVFSLNARARKSLEALFHKYTDRATYEFSKTSVKVKLFREGAKHISRSEARRIMVGLEKFKEITIDFGGIDVVGQGFADEIFRVWAARHPKNEIYAVCANKTAQFMIQRVKSACNYDVGNRKNRKNRKVEKF